MTNPNTVNATSITEGTIQIALTTAQVSALSNASGSGTLVKLTELMIANITTAQISVLAKSYSAAALGGTAYQFAPSIAIPPNTTIVLVDDTTAKTLTEDKSIGLSASSGSALEVTGSYKILT